MLDAGCYAGDLITSEVITALGCMDKVQPCNEVVGICLHGDPLKSTGTIELLWEGSGLYKVFRTRFHVVDGDAFAWQIILGAETCASHSLLTVGAFGGSKHQVHPKGKSKSFSLHRCISSQGSLTFSELDARDKARMDSHKENIATNAERVKRDKAERKAKKDEQQRGNTGGSSGDKH